MAFEKGKVRVGKVSIAVQKSDRQYYLEWGEPGNSKKRRSKATGFYATGRKGIPTEVKDMAEEKWLEITEAKVRHEDVGGRHSALYIKTSEAIDQAIEHSKSKSEGHRHNHAKQKQYFLQWLKDEKKQVDPLFSDITRQTMLEYAAYLGQHGTPVGPPKKGQTKRLSKKCSPKTVKNYLATVLMANRHWALNTNGAIPLIMSVESRYTTVDSVPKKVYLSWEEVKELLEFLGGRGGHRYVEEGFILSTFLGLNLFELAGLRKNDYDPIEQTLHIPESKTPWRIRTIPLPTAVNAWCKVKFAELEKPDSHLVTLEDGSKVTRYTTIANAVKRYLLTPAAKAEKCKVVSARDLRKTAINLSRLAEVPEQYAERYFGHRPGSVHRQHYADDADLAMLRKHVVKLMEKQFPELGKAKTLFNFSV